MIGCSNLRPFDFQGWWQKQLARYQPDWDEYCALSAEEQARTLKDRQDQYKEYKENLTSLTSRTSYFMGFVTLVLGGGILPHPGSAIRPMACQGGERINLDELASLARGNAGEAQLDLQKTPYGQPMAEAYQE